MATKSSLYGTFKAAGAAEGKYKGTLAALTGIEGERTAESMISDFKSEQLRDTTAAITEAIGLVQDYKQEQKEQERFDEFFGKKSPQEAKDENETLKEKDEDEIISTQEQDDELVKTNIISDEERDRIAKEKKRLATKKTAETTPTIDLANENKPSLYEEWRQGSGLTLEANQELYAEYPEMKGKPASERVAKYQELLANKEKKSINYEYGDEILGEYGMTNPLGIQ
tara:strand:+ start:3005 stop:3685 length:681 start_codon:yes stop_codon:yes gene_type:complete